MQKENNKKENNNGLVVVWPKLTAEDVDFKISKIKSVSRKNEVNQILRSFMERDKIKCSDTDVLHVQEACGDLYNLIEKGGINNLKELKAYCNDNTNFIIGSTICKIIMDDLEELCSNGHHSKIVKKLAIPEWVTDCVFENYIRKIGVTEWLAGCVFEKYMKRNPGYYETENPLKYNKFTFSYERAKTAIGEWLEKIVVAAIQKLEIHPVNLAQYFSLLKSEYCEKYLPFYAAYVKHLVKNANGMRYCKNITYCPDPLGMLFLVTLGKGIIRS